MRRYATPGKMMRLVPNPGTSDATAATVPHNAGAGMPKAVKAKPVDTPSRIPTTSDPIKIDWMPLLKDRTTKI
jgi:hypothetical protein